MASGRGASSRLESSTPCVRTPRSPNQLTTSHTAVQASTAASVDCHRARKKLRSSASYSRRAIMRPNGAAFVFIQAIAMEESVAHTFRLMPMRPASTGPRKFIRMGLNSCEVM